MAYLTDSRSGRPLSSPWCMILGENNFPQRSERIPTKKREEGALFEVDDWEHPKAED